MQNQQELFIDHEVRVRMLENLAGETKFQMQELRKEIHSNFKWTIGIVGGFFSAILVSIIVAIFLKVFQVG
jgi:hypothetical protein